MRRRAKIPTMSPRKDADVWEQATHDAALAHAMDGELSRDELREAQDRRVIDDLLAAARQRLANRARPLLAAGSLQPTQIEVMGMERTALLARLALSMRNGSIAPRKALDALSDDELRQLIVEAEG
jgi:hypothetical protein